MKGEDFDKILYIIKDNLDKSPLDIFRIIMISRIIRFNEFPLYNAEYLDKYKDNIIRKLNEKNRRLRLELLGYKNGFLIDKRT